MGLTAEQVIVRLQMITESGNLSEMENPLRVYDDITGFVVGSERRIGPGNTFLLRIPFSVDSTSLQGKTPQKVEIFLQAVAAGELSLRSNMAIAGITHTLQEPLLSQMENGTWEMLMELANDSPRYVIIPDELKIGRPFERPDKALEGIELVRAAANLCKDESDHVMFLTKNGEFISFEALLQSKNAFESDSPYYPIAVFLPYTEEIGVIEPGEDFDLHKMPNRRKGFVEQNVNWHGHLTSNGRKNPAVVLKRTRGNIEIPEGYVGVIREQGIPGEIPHSRSTVLSAGYAWPIIGEHPPRTAGNNLINPTGFIMQMYYAS